MENWEKHDKEMLGYAVFILLIGVCIMAVTYCNFPHNGIPALIIGLGFANVLSAIFIILTIRKRNKKEMYNG